MKKFHDIINVSRKKKREYIIIKQTEKHVPDKLHLA